MEDRRCRSVLLLWCAVLLGLAGVARAGTWTVEWDPNPAGENVSGYVVSYGHVSRADQGFRGYEVDVDVGRATRHTIEIPGRGPLYVAIRAYSDTGVKSDFSEEIVLGGPGRAGSGGGLPTRGPKEKAISSSRSETLGSRRPAGTPPGEGRQPPSARSPTRQELNQIAELERKLHAMLRTRTAKHPDVRALQRQLDRLRRQVGSSP